MAQITVSEAEDSFFFFVAYCPWSGAGSEMHVYFGVSCTGEECVEVGQVMIKTMCYSDER